MTFDELINNGWARHDTQSAALAADLEEHQALAATPQNAVALLGLANHTIGYHMKDWPRARALCERVVARFAPEAALSPIFGSLAIAQFMCGDQAAALASECRAVELNAEEPLSAMVRTRVLIASELADAGRLGEAMPLYTATLNLARSRKEKLGCDRAIAITSNNLAGNLLEKKGRTPVEDDLMLSAAEASREFWMKIGTWENEERGEYLLALAKNALGRPAEGLKHALRGLEVIAAGGGGEKVDQAFLNLAAARSHKLLGDAALHTAALARADGLAAGFEKQGLKNWFVEERAKVVA